MFLKTLLKNSPGAVAGFAEVVYNLALTHIAEAK